MRQRGATRYDKSRLEELGIVGAPGSEVGLNAALLRAQRHYELELRGSNDQNERFTQRAAKLLGISEGLLARRIRAAAIVEANPEFANYNNTKLILRAVTPEGIPEKPASALEILMTKFTELRQSSRQKTQLTFREAIAILWDFHLKYSRGGRLYLRKLDRLAGYFEGRTIDTITPEDVLLYRRQRKALGIKDTTIDREHGVITLLFHRLRRWKRQKKLGDIDTVYWQLPEDNPGSEVPRTDYRHTARRRVLTVEEIGRLLAVADREMRLLIMGALDTGLRRSDLRALTKDNINPATGCLEGIQCKTQKPFSIPINAQMRSIIEGVKGNYLFNFSNFQPRLHAARKAAGIPYFQFRDLRRTSAKHLLMAGATTVHVRDWLGHQSLRMTEMYLPPTREELRENAENLAARFDSCQIGSIQKQSQLEEAR